MQQALQVLKKYWNHDSFRAPQEEIITSVLSGRDTFALMPTGGGKSICFQVPAMMQDGLCLVVSPLIALMKDQVQNLQKRDINAIALTGGISEDEISNQLDNCKFGGYKFLYLSPERLESDWIIDRIKELPINLVAIDEAHCVSQWGHDFRPAYLKISLLKKHLPKVPFIALTASATHRVQEDVIKHLGLNDPQVFKKSFARPNIAYMVFECEDKLTRLQQILTKNTGSAIVYVRNRRACHDVSRQMQSMGFTATYYHGGLKEKEKTANMQAWLQNDCQVVVATNAFGMGIDKPDVKTVTHIQLPENLESYYQEAGRAGRNGEKSFGVVLMHPTDITMAKGQFIDGLADRAFLKQVYLKLNAFLQIAYGEGPGEVYPFNFNDFCKKYNFPAVKAYHTLQFLDRQGVLTLSQEFTEKVYVQFIIPSREVVRYTSLNPADEEAILVLLRSYTGIFDMETAVNAGMVAAKAKISIDVFMQMLRRMEAQGVLSLRALGNDSSIVFNEVREDDHTVNRIAKYLEQQNSIKKEQFESVVQYITDTTHCKSRLILEYFDEEVKEDCGICSYCITQKRQIQSPIETATAILGLLGQKPLSSQGIGQELDLLPEEVVQAVQLLLNARRITINTNNEYILV
ncbi:ATP-dependent DNA helicase RecQ [Flavobacterium sp. RHBU_3]|uniref:RecQ family ATP-dependent DNA helicase n=1 Tax=Flavobacterium sp. RHBU_3 TaxID=3391184 RepID=UPI0039854FE0